MPARAVFLAALLVGAVLRFPDLAARPMHADEAVHAQKFGTLLEGGGYAYDPAEYHGPTLYYLTLLPAWLRGQSRYVEIDEVTLRSVPAALGVAVVAGHVFARGMLGATGAAAAALLAAVSPAMVFYSRYFIHETALVLFSLGALLASGRYLARRPQTADLTPVFAGGCVGLMLATKETAVLALGCLLLALVLTRAAGTRVVAVRDVGRAAVVAVAVAALFFSSFLTRPAGVGDAVRAYAVYLDRAGGASWHVQPWSYYLGLLVHFPPEGTPLWTEGLILVLAVVGAAAGWANRVPGADPAALRLIGIYTVLLLVAYSAIPYKTPWCLLGFLHGMILLAGGGAVFLVRSVPGGVVKAGVVVVLVAGTGHLAWQAFQGSFRFAADPRNPYVYAHTGPDVFEIVARVKDVARAHPDGPSLHVQVVSGQNMWPLPFYLRDMPRVGWWTAAPTSGPNAPLILLTPDREADVVRRLYDLPPPGERELYVSIFDRPVELRPGVEVRGYAGNGLWDDYRQREAEAVADTRGVRE